MPTSTTVKGLNINELTEAQYDAAVQGGVIGPNELSVLTDVSYVEPSDLATVATTGDYDDLINKPTIPAAIQVSSMPTAGVDELGKIYQFVGATDASYTNGYFYKCVSDGQTPATYSWEQTDVQPAGSSLPDQTGQSGKFLTTDGSSASWAAVNALQNTATGNNSLAVLGTATGIAAVSVGKSTASNDLGATACGSSAVAGASYSCCFGYNAQCSGQYGLAVGRAASVTAIGGILINTSGTNKTNSDANTFKVANANGNFELMSADGTIPTARFTTDPSADGTYVPTLTISSGVATRSWSAPSGGLPSQTGNSGKFLTTDGTDASWGNALQYNFRITNTYKDVLLFNSNIAFGIYQMNAGATNYNNPFIVFDYNSDDIQFHQGNNGTLGANGNGLKTIVTKNISNGNQGGSDTRWLIEVPKIAGTMAVISVNTTITLTAAGWSSNTQTVTVNGVTSTSVVFVAPDPSDTTDYVAAGILCTSQTTDSLTFTATTTPTNDIDVNIVCL